MRKFGGVMYFPSLLFGLLFVYHRAYVAASSNPYSFENSPSDIGREWARISVEDAEKSNAQSLQPFVFPPGYELPSAELTSPRPPGTLLLNMLIKNEREHLDRTLPLWAHIIDCWVIGVDDANTDDSEEVILRHLSHIPGAIVTVKFDGMGPTWSVLVNHGIEHFSQCTHGIISDADFAPAQLSLDKMQLDIRCSKHMFSIVSQNRESARNMDWIYRNVPGARVERRTHQVLRVPTLRDQKVSQTMINLTIEERPGGYQDRTPGKMERYIQFLQDDLVDYPNDPRSLYYIAHGHYDIFSSLLQNFDQDPGRNDPIKREELLKEIHHQARLSVRYFTQRAGLFATGNLEERYFAFLKLGEMYDRYFNALPLNILTIPTLSNEQDEIRDENPTIQTILQDQTLSTRVKSKTIAKYWYRRAARLDPDRADSFFYYGQLLMIENEPVESLWWLFRSATLPIPLRSVFQWQELYTCISKMEFYRSLSQVLTLLGKNQRTGQDYLPVKKHETSLFVRGFDAEQNYLTEMEIPVDPSLEAVFHPGQPQSNDVFDALFQRILQSTMTQSPTKEWEFQLQQKDIRHLLSALPNPKCQGQNLTILSHFRSTVESLLQQMTLNSENSSSVSSSQSSPSPPLPPPPSSPASPASPPSPSRNKNKKTNLSVKQLTSTRMKPVVSLLRLVHTIDEKYLDKIPNFQLAMDEKSLSVDILESLPEEVMDNGEVVRDTSFYSVLQYYLDQLRTYRDTYASLKKEAKNKNKSGKTSPHMVFLQDCAKFHEVTSGYSAFVKTHWQRISASLANEGVVDSVQQWLNYNNSIANACS